MISEKQLEANRRNAQKSTGPRTREGKDRVRLNALAHGLRAEALDVLPNEDPAAFSARIEAWESDWQPTGESQAFLVRQAALYSWKIDRADRYETAVLTGGILDAVDSCDCEDDDSEAISGAAALASFDPSNEGERLRRYQASLYRGMLRTMDVLAKLKREQAKVEADGRNDAIPDAPASASMESGAGPEINPPRSAIAAAPNKPISPTPAAPNKPISPRAMGFASQPSTAA